MPGDIPPMGRKSYISPAAWDALRMDYLNGNGTVRTLAVRHGINPGTAEQKCKRERWTTQRAEFLAKKRELLASPAPALLPVLNPPNGHLPPAALPPDGLNFAALNERFHALAGPILERVDEVLKELTLPQTASERLALANSVRTLTQTAREILGIPLVAAIKRKERQNKWQMVLPEPITISRDQPDQESPTEADPGNIGPA